MAPDVVEPPEQPTLAKVADNSDELDDDLSMDGEDSRHVLVENNLPAGNPTPPMGNNNIMKIKFPF